MEESGAIDRRTVLAMIGASVVLAACGTSTKSTTSTNVSSPVSTTATAVGSDTTVTVPGVPAGARLADADVEAMLNDWPGTWLGSWADDKHSSGHADIAVTADRAAKAIRVTLTLTGEVLGSAAPPPATYVVALGGIPDHNAFPASSPQLGRVEVDEAGETVTCTGIPDHPDLASLRVEGWPRAEGARATWTATTKTGSVSRGVIVWSAKNGPRPATPSLTGLSIADFTRGDYAAGLITTGEVTHAFGRPAKAPQANGGRQQFQIGIDTSNGVATSVDGKLYAQWTVYRAATAAGAKAYFALNQTISTAIPGLGDAAQIFTSGLATLQVLKGLEVLEINFNDTVGALTVNQRETVERELATAMLPRMTQ